MAENLTIWIGDWQVRSMGYAHMLGNALAQVTSCLPAISLGTETTSVFVDDIALHMLWNIIFKLEIPTNRKVILEN